MKMVLQIRAYKGSIDFKHAYYLDTLLDVKHCTPTFIITALYRDLPEINWLKGNSFCVHQEDYLKYR